MQLSGSLPPRRAKTRAMSSAVPMLLAPTNVRLSHTRITVSQVLQAWAGVAESADIIAIPSRAAVPERRASCAYLSERRSLRSPGQQTCQAPSHSPTLPSSEIAVARNVAEKRHLFKVWDHRSDRPASADR
jgi:hypothetical protein